MSLQATGIGKANITLQDPQCKATSNSTHYILETPLTGCQTTKYPLNYPSPKIIYINSVSIIIIIIIGENGTITKQKENECACI